MSFVPPPDFPDDSVNPYAAPKAEIGGRPDLPGLAPIPVAVGDILTRSWEIYKDRLGITLGIVFGVFGMNWAFQMVVNMMVAGVTVAKGSPMAVLAVQLVGFVAGLIFQVWLTIGQTKALLKIAKGRDAEFADIFTGGRHLLTTFVAGILVGLMYLGVAVVCVGPGGILAAVNRGQGGLPMQIALGVGGLFALLAIVAISLRVSQFLYLIVDRDEGIIGSLALSNQITKGSEGSIFLIWILTSAINVGGLMACFVGMIFTLPLTLLMMAVLYVALTGQQGVAMLGAVDFLPESKPLSDRDFGEPL